MINEELEDQFELDPDEIGDDEESGGSFEHYRFVADKGQSTIRVDKYLTAHMEKTSRHRIQLAIGAGYVLVNDKIVKSNYTVKPNDIIRIVRTILF